MSPRCQAGDDLRLRDRQHRRVIRLDAFLLQGLEQHEMVGRDRRGGELLALQVGQRLDAAAVARDQRFVLAGGAADIDRLHVDALADGGGEGAGADIADLHVAGGDGGEDLGAGIELAELDLPAGNGLELAGSHRPHERREAGLAGPPGTCARVAVSGLSARTVRQNRHGRQAGASGRDSRFDHARTADGAGVTLPASLDEAVAALDAMPAAVPVAGGTDLMAAVNSGLLRPAALVGLGRISEIRGWQYPDGHALLGAGLTHARMGRPDFAALIPALAAAARAAGPPQIRNAGTLGGNIVTAAPTGDALPVLAALEATADPRRPRRRTPRGPGQPPARRHGHAAPGEFSASCASRCCTPRRPSSRPPAAPAPAAPPPPSRSSSTRRGAACAARSAPSPRCRCARWRPRAGWPASSTGTASAASSPRRCTAFGEYVAMACIPDPPGRRTAREAAARRAAPAAHGRRTGPPRTGEGAVVSDEPRRGARGPDGWEPLPQGDYDADATAFVQLEGRASRRRAGWGRAGHGYVPPQITARPARGHGPAATGAWVAAARRDRPGRRAHRRARAEAHWPDPPSTPNLAALRGACPYRPRGRGRPGSELRTAEQPARPTGMPVRRTGAAAGRGQAGQWSMPVSPERIRRTSRASSASRPGRAVGAGRLRRRCRGGARGALGGRGVGAGPPRGRTSGARGRSGVRAARRRYPTPYAAQATRQPRPRVPAPGRSRTSEPAKRHAAADVGRRSRRRNRCGSPTPSFEAAGARPAEAPEAGEAPGSPTAPDPRGRRATSPTPDAVVARPRTTSTPSPPTSCASTAPTGPSPTPGSASPCSTCCASASASPAPRTAARRASAGPARCRSTAGSSPPAWCPRATAAGSEVRTVEGLAADGRALRRAARAGRAAAPCSAASACPGMAMTVHDLLEGNHRPDRAGDPPGALRQPVPLLRLPRASSTPYSEVVAEREASAATAGADGSRADDAGDGTARIPHQAAPRRSAASDRRALPDRTIDRTEAWRDATSSRSPQPRPGPP